MKQILLSASFLLVAFCAANAQSLTITPNPVEAFFDNVTLEPFLDLESHVAVKNNSTTDSIHLKWQREIPEACPAGWETLVCDNVRCYGANTSTNYNLAFDLDDPFSLAPGETFPEFLLHVQPNLQAGCCRVLIHLSTVENPDVILETIDFDVRINDPDCLLSSTKEPSVLNSLKAFPNPSTGEFSISDNPLVKKIVVYNLLGKEVQSFAYTNGTYYNISAAPDGLYLLSMQDANGEVLKTVRMTKQELRP